MESEEQKPQTLIKWTSANLCTSFE